MRCPAPQLSGIHSHRATAAGASCGSEIVRDIRQFLVVLAVFVIAFTHVLWLSSQRRRGGAPDEPDAAADEQDGEDGDGARAFGTLFQAL